MRSFSGSLRRVLVLGIGLSVGASLQGTAPVPIGPEQVVNTTLEGRQRNPAVSARPDHGFVVVWSDYGTYYCAGEAPGPCHPLGIHARRFDRLGVPQGDQFRVTTSIANYFDRHVNPAVSQDPAGDFAVVWNKHLDDCCQYGGGKLLMRPYRQDGTPAAGELQVDTFGRNPDVAKADDGTFLMVWERVDLKAQLFDSDGAQLSSPVTFATPESGSSGPLPGWPAVAHQVGGSFVVVWTVGNGAYWPTVGLEIHAQRLANDGSLLGPSFPVSATPGAGGERIHPDVAAATDGGFLVVWQATEPEGDGFGIFARRFTTDGTPASAETQINQYFTGDQRFPQVAGQADGSFVVTWTSDGQDGDAEGIFARTVSAAGLPTGPELPINSVAAGSQTQPAVASNGAGDFMVAWSSQIPGGGYYDFEVEARLFRPAEVFTDGFESGDLSAWSLVVQ
jgi:hypothetical protein